MPDISTMALDDLVALNQTLGAEQDAIRDRRKDIAAEIRKRVAAAGDPSAQAMIAAEQSLREAGDVAAADAMRAAMAARGIAPAAVVAAGSAGG